MADKIRKVWIFAGEASGDLYGARLANELKQKLGDSVTIAGMGGPQMRAANVEIIIDSTELGVFGFFEFITQIFKFVRIFLYLRKLALAERPDAIILIDYPGFNLRFAKQMHKAGIPVIWYISPQVWTWGKKRIPLLAKYCKKMLVIFPFETDVYAGTGLDVEFVGHPLVEIVEKRSDPSLARDPNRFLLLPGSRRSEIERLMHPMLSTVAALHARRPELKFAISAPREKIRHMIDESLSSFRLQHPDLRLPELEISSGDTARWLQEAGTGLAASGTVTVECAIAGLPLVVIYKISPLTFFIAKHIIRIKFFRNFFTMVNIIAENEVYQEFLQEFVTPENLLPAVEKILPGGERRAVVESEIDRVKKMLAVGTGSKARRASEAVAEFLSVGPA